MHWITLFLVGISLITIHDNGQYAQSSPELKQWFNGLTNHAKGLCCSFADGQSIDDVDWRRVDTHYEVFYDGQWWIVPPETLVIGNNRIGRAILWPVIENGKMRIRCFMPGAEG